jgi:hypothetical protein
VPSSGLFVRTDPQPITSSYKKTIYVFLTINWMCLTEKNLHFVYIQGQILMTKVIYLIYLGTWGGVVVKALRY